ncbi:MAG: HAMP domain-containing sensor histidine kinase [Eubacteriales bacterium]
MKFKTIFSRLLLTYMLVTIIAIFVLSALISFAYQNYIFDEKRKSLESVANKITSMTIDYYGGKVKIDELDAAINAMSYISNSMVYVLKIDPAKFDINDLQLKGLQDAISASEMKKILSGDKIYEKKNYSKDFQTYVLLSGQPLEIAGKIEGAVLVFCPENKIKGYIEQMNLKILASALLVFLLCSPLIYFNARKISKPIKIMDNALRKIAFGEKIKKEPIKSDDEIGRLSQSFWDMQGQLEKTETIRRDLIANISHELRTPLTSMNGFVQGMIDGVIPKENYSLYLGLIMEENQRLISLTSEILELAKIQGGSIKLNMENIPVLGIITKVVSGMEPMAFKNNVSIKIDFDEEISIFADVERLTQILINILSNALKYSSPGGEIHISANGENEWVKIMVMDNGIGIAAEDLPFIFDKFYQADKSRSAGNDGSGLGLNIAKNLVEIQGGKLTAESKLGEGTIISLIIPKA